MPSATKPNSAMVLQDPVGLQEIARRLHVSTNTVRVWRVRNRFPAPACKVSNVPLWTWPQVQQWAEDTGRWPRPAASPAKPAAGAAAKTPAKGAKSNGVSSKPASKAKAKTSAK